MWSTWEWFKLWPGIFWTHIVSTFQKAKVPMSWCLYTADIYISFCHRKMMVVKQGLLAVRLSDWHLWPQERCMLCLGCPCMQHIAHTPVFSLISLYLGNFSPLLLSKKIWLCTWTSSWGVTDRMRRRNVLPMLWHTEPRPCSWETMGISGQVWTTSINVTKVNWILNWLYTLVHKIEFLICIEK